MANPLLQQLLTFAKENNYKVTSADGGKHNVGSLHGLGRAIDIANQGVDREKLFQMAQSLGFRVLDETTRPARQAVWGGPHYHIEIPRDAKVTQLTPKDINVAIGQSNPVPITPPFAAVDIPKNPAEFEKQLQDLAKYSKTSVNQFAQAANTPKANPTSAFLGGLAQGASANIYKAPAVNPRDVGFQGAGNIAGSLVPILGGSVLGGPVGLAAGGAAVGAGQSFRQQEAEIAAGRRQGYSLPGIAAQGGIGALGAVVPVLGSGLGLGARVGVNALAGAGLNAAGGLVDRSVDPQSTMTNEDIFNSSVMGAGLGGVVGAFHGPTKAPMPIEPPAARQPLMLTGGTAPRAMPTLRQPLQLTGGVVDPLQGGGVRLRPEATIAPDGGGIPVQGEVLPPEIPPVIQQAKQAFKANPATVLPQNPLSAVADETNRSIFMNKSAANQALKATGAPNDHVIVQDAGRYMVVPKGQPIPKAEPMFTRGQKVKVDGKDLTVINEPFGQVAVRLPDGNVRVVPREAVISQMDTLAAQADQLAAFEARRAPVEAPTEPVQVSTFKRAEGEIIPPKPEALPEQPASVEAIKKIYHGTDKIFDEFDVSKSADGTIWFTDNKSKIENGEVAAAGKGQIMERYINESKLKLGNWDDADNYSVDELISRGYDGLKLVDDDEITYQIFNPKKLSKVSDLSTQVAETPVVAKVMEPEAPRPQVAEGQSPTRLPQALADSGFKSLDEARMVREKLGLKRSDASVIKAGKELGLTPEEALRLKAAYDNSPANVKTLLKEDIDLTTGLGQQRYGNQVPLAHESLTEVVASLTPQQREIAQVLQRAIELDRPVAESFRRERAKGGATSGTAGDFGSFTPIGFEKVGRDLKAVGYNENGDFAGRIINSINEKDSGFNAIPRILESQQPFVGNYANVTKELGQFKVDDILGRVTRADAIKTSDIKAAINSATDLIKNPNTPERVKRLAQQLLDDPTPAGVNKARRKLIAEAETKTDAELERMIKEMGGRC